MRKILDYLIIAFVVSLVTVWSASRKIRTRIIKGKKHYNYRE